MVETLGSDSADALNLLLIDDNYDLRIVESTESTQGGVYFSF